MAEIQFSKAELIQRIQSGWQTLQDYIATLNEHQLTVPTDAAGWRVLDHLNHISRWEQGIDALLNSQPRAERMGFDPALWETGDYDHINEILRQQDLGLSSAQALAMLNGEHDKFLTTALNLSEDGFLLPYNHYQPDSTADRPVWHWIVGNTYEHYVEHIPWMEAIVANG